ncbi:hypothetical protein AOLI_G00120630 [Acnodon oligacanthus]
MTSDQLGAADDRRTFASVDRLKARGLRPRPILCFPPITAQLRASDDKHTSSSTNADCSGNWAWSCRSQACSIAEEVADTRSVLQQWGKRSWLVRLTASLTPVLHCGTFCSHTDRLEMCLVITSFS